MSVIFSGGHPPRGRTRDGRDARGAAPPTLVPPGGPSTLHGGERRRFSGFTLWDGRRGGFCWDEKPRCVGHPAEEHGHLLRTRGDRPVFSDTLVECVNGARPGDPGCGRRLYIARFCFGGSARMRGTGDIVWLVVEVTTEHVQRMKSEPMILLERFELIDVALPGVALDLAAGVDDTGGG